MSLQDEVVQKIRERRAGWIVELANLQKKLGELQGEIDEADSMLARLGFDDPPAQRPCPDLPEREPLSFDPPRQSAGGQGIPLSPTSPPRTSPPAETRVKTGSAASRAGFEYQEWLGVIRREFRDREFTSLELVSAMPGLDGNSDSHRQAARDVLRKLPEVEQVTIGRDQRYRLKPTIVCGPGALAAAQAAWDERNGNGDDPGRAPRVDRGQPVPGTGRSSALNGVPKDLVEIIQPALDAGWVPSVTGKNKVKIAHPTQRSRFFRVPTTPGDHRTAQNLRGEMRGVNAPGV